MKFLLVNRFYGDSHTPTARMLGDVAEALATSGHNITILTSDASYLPSGNQPATATCKFIKVERIHIPASLPRLIQWLIFHLLAYIKGLMQDWDRVVYLTDPPFLTAHFITQRCFFPNRLAYLWSMDLYPEALHSAELLKNTSWVYRALWKLNDWSFKSLHGAVVLGECQQARLNQYPHFRGLSKKAIVIPPWDSREIRRILPQENRILELYPEWREKKILLYAGNLGAGHTYDSILQLAQWMKSQGKEDWKFVFAVRGQKVASLKSKAKDLSSVVVMDYVVPELTDHLLSAADAHLITMTPKWEGVIVPSKLYGCLKTGRPVLFIGPHSSGTALEISRLQQGTCVSPEITPAALLENLELLAKLASTDSFSHTRSVAQFCHYVTSLD